MRLDGRGVILSMWLTILIGSISSLWVVNHFLPIEGGDGLPNRFEGALWLVLGLWVGGILAALVLTYLGWYRDLSELIWTVLLGYGLGALVRLIFLGRFLDGARDAWDTLWGVVKLQDFPPYDAFVLLVLPVGFLLVAAAAVTSAVLLPALNLRAAWSAERVKPRLLGSIFLLMPIVLVSLVAIRTLNSQTSTAEIALLNTEWLTLPQTNMILAALLGFVVGGAYLCESRFAAAVTLFLSASAHVIVMLLIDSTAASYDPFYDGINPNQVNFLPFVFFWIGTPAIGAIAAFALHNLRDAFSLPSNTEIQES